MIERLTTVSVCLLVAALARSQSGSTPTDLVAQLAIANQRASARQQLLALGKQAMPLLAGRINSADPVLLPELLALLVDFGPDAGALVPELLAALQSRPRKQAIPKLWALAELIPYRAPGVEFDIRDVTRVMDEQAHLNAVRGGLNLEQAIGRQRLLRRFDFPRTPDVETLLTIVQGFHPYRVELAVEHLGQHGAAAQAALPFLRRLLERPEPKILTTQRTVPMHRKAAHAVLAIAPTGDPAELARAVLAGKGPAAAAALVVPERARARIAELLAELDVPEQRAAAATNLTALGKVAAPAVAATLVQEHDTAFREAALGILRDIGPRAASTVTQLLAALITLSTEHTVSVLHALQATAPWCTDVVPELNSRCSMGNVQLLGSRIAGGADAAFLTSFFAAQDRYQAAMAVDPSSSLAELGMLLGSPRVTTREAVLAVVRERGPEARPLLPSLATMLKATQPKTSVVVWHDSGVEESRLTDRTVVVQRLAAQAIVAIAASDDPLVATARAVLAGPEPK